MKKQSLQKGFTLIELLVVVAIIAMLAAIILASLGQARNKARASKVTSELSSLRAQMELYASDHNGDYSNGGNCALGAFADTTPDGGGTLMSGINTDLNGTGGNFTNMNCDANGSSWAAAAVLPGSSAVWCVDSGGRSIQSAVDLAHTVTTNSQTNTVECAH